MLISGTAISLLLIALSTVFQCRILRVIGTYSIVPYVLHSYVLTVVRVCLDYFEVSNCWVYIISGTVLGTVIPLGVVYIYTRFKFLRWIEYIFYPMKYISYLKNRN